MKQRPASAPGSLASVFLRQTASIEGKEKAFVTLGKLMKKAYTRDSIAGTDKFRNTVINAKKFVLSTKFTELADMLIIDGKHASETKLKSLWQFGIMPFDPTWIEFYDYGSDMQTGILIDSSPKWPDAMRFRVVFKEEGGVCVAPPMGVISTLHSGIIDEIGIKDQKEMAGMLSKDMFSKDLVWLVPYIRPVVAHSGGLTFKLVAPGQKDPRWDEQGDRAWSIAAHAYFQAITFLGLLCLAPIRHIVQTHDMIKPVNADKDWHWKHDHKVVELVRPITVREVHQHIVEGQNQRKSPAMHEVMGFWRVRGGRPECNHRWHQEERTHGTDTELGRPHRTEGISRFRCSQCSALRSWVHAHTRGDASQGVISKEFTVDAPKGSQ